ncbi:ovomucoid-like [Coccinella septempunctata]|uniref:ovomucoid-like n=1 Tax=Coccinella septempunctata TaxID=41139 RepID=UPI001D09990E|nr:ovomucoid-like [Coccinella septempunctata]
MKFFVLFFVALILALATGLPAQSKSATKKPKTAFQQCTDSCEFNRHLRPVCGTDGKSYPNPGILECHNRCGHSVQVASDGFCRKDLPKSLRN